MPLVLPLCEQTDITVTSRGAVECSTPWTFTEPSTVVLNGDETITQSEANEILAAFALLLTTVFVGRLIFKMMDLSPRP